MTSVNDLVSGVINRIDDIPSSITGSPIIYEYINDARKDIQNITGDTISEGNVGERYHTILKNLGAAYTLSRMTGIGVDFDYALGNFRVMKGAGGNDPNMKQMQFFLNQASNSLKYIRKIPYAATFL